LKLHFLINTGMRSSKQILNPFLPFFHCRGADFMAVGKFGPSPPPTPTTTEIKNKGKPEDEKKGEKDHVEDREGRRKDQYQILPEQDQHNSKLKEKQ
jgi:hypothetical protein